MIILMNYIVISSLWVWSDLCKILSNYWQGVRNIRSVRKTTTCNLQTPCFPVYQSVTKPLPFYLSCNKLAANDFFLSARVFSLARSGSRYPIKKRRAGQLNNWIRWLGGWRVPWSPQWFIWRGLQTAAGDVSGDDLIKTCQIWEHHQLFRLRYGSSSPPFILLNIKFKKRKKILQPTLLRHQKWIAAEELPAMV